MTREKLDAVLPLTLADYEQFRILDYSIQKFFDCLGTLWIVVPDKELNELAARIQSTRYRVIPESVLVPELRYYRHVMRPVVSARLRRNQRLGWFVQQLVKMAVATSVETDFYLTLDADVVCVKPVRFEALIRDGRAVINTTPDDWHSEWNGWSERVLGMRRSGLTHGVTPAVFSTQAMMKLHDHLANLVGDRARWVAGLTRPGSGIESACLSWRGYLLRNMPWTEYGLYYTYLQATNQFARFHFAGGANAIYDTYGSVWFANQLSSWDPKDVHQDSFFVVVQSWLGISPEYVMQKIKQL